MMRLLVLVALVAGGCGNHASVIPPDALSVDQALLAAPRHHVRVHGYFFDPFDDVARLCPEPSNSSCYPKKGLIIEGVDPYELSGLEEGCCSIGFWSRSEIVLEGRLKRGRIIVTPASPGDL